MADADFILTPGETHRARRKRGIIVTGALALVILGGVFGARPTAHAIRAWQARRHAQKAFVLINTEQWSDARSEAVAAYQLRPSEPQALRAVARFLSRTHQLEALDFWKQLAERARLTHEDVRDEAMIAIIAGDRTRADAAVRELVGSRAEPADWLLAAQLAIQKNLPDEAKSCLEKTMADSRATLSEQLRATLLQVALTGSNQTERANALTRLKKLAAGKTATSLDALVVLAQNALSASTDSSDSTGNEAGDLARALENHPLAKAQHKLLAFDLRVHANPTQREQLIARAIADWKDAAPADLAAFAAWLNGKGEYQREIDTIPLEKAFQSRDLFLQRLDALAALGRWREIKQLLGSERFPLEPVLQAMYLARCGSQLGEKTAAENNWQRALEAAEGDARKLMTLGDYAEKNGNAKIAEAAYNGAAAVAPKLRVSQDGRLRLAHASRDTKKMHAVLADMLVLWPDDPAIQNDEAYTRLLLLPSANGEEHVDEINAIEQLAEKLVQQNPASLPHRTLLALARLKQHRPFAALEVYSNIQIVPNAVSPSALAVHAAVLAANDRRNDARHEIEQAPLDKLLPEEQAGTADLR
jgi:hypothetical protein